MRGFAAVHVETSARGLNITRGIGLFMAKYIRQFFVVAVNEGCWLLLKPLEPKNSIPSHLRFSQSAERHASAV